MLLCKMEVVMAVSVTTESHEKGKVRILHKFYKGCLENELTCLSGEMLRFPELPRDLLCAAQL